MQSSIIKNTAQNKALNKKAALKTKQNKNIPPHT